MNGMLANDDGFQPVLSASDRRRLRKQGKVSASEVGTDRQEDKRSSKYYTSAVNKFKARLEAVGIDCSELPVTSKVAAACTATVDELIELVGNLDLTIKSAPSNVMKPLQFKTVDEIDSRIRAANEQLRRLKANRGKPAGPTDEELNHVTAESEAYVSHLREQRVVVEDYQRMKGFQATLFQYKKACLDTVELKSRASKFLNSTANQAGSTEDMRSSRKTEHICDFLRRLKAEKGLPLDQSTLTRSDLVIMATAYRFHPPYNYMRRIKEKFCVYTENVDSTGTEISAVHVVVHGEENDVAECTKFLKSIDFHASKNLKVDLDHLKKIFGGIFGLSTLEDSFNVLTFYYQGILDIIGSRDGVNLAVNYVEEKVSDLCNKDSKSNTGRSGALANMAEFEARKVQLQYDYPICKALTTRFRSLVRNVEIDFGVSVSLEMSPKEGKGFLSVNVDSGNTSAKSSAEECISNAVERLKEVIDPLCYSEVPGTFDEATMSFLFSTDILRSRFVSHEFCLLRYNGAPFVVAAKANLKYGIDRVKALLRCMNIKPKEYFVPMEKVILLSDSTLSAIEDWTGVTIMTRDSINGIVLAISGDIDQQEECVKQIDDILKTHIEYTFDLSPAHFAVLSDNKYRIIRELEEKSQVKIVAKRESSQLVFHGQKDKVDDAVSVMKAFTDNFVCLDQTKIDDVSLTGHFYGWIRVPRRHVAAVIGKGGSTIREIINDSGLRNMFVNRSDGADEIVCFEGKKDAVKRALVVLSHILEFDGVNQKIQPMEDLYVGKYSSAHSTLRSNVSAAPQRVASSVMPNGAKPIVFDCRDEDNFPGLRRNN
ncbi:hypothetical protein X943_001717 [Babesia divergens]|uniref:K Homology domain-containing protein n=1 Tax=Babesia divergens TaxID=32595 RepID=A0AAD9GD19_BABDI|nr:hypothetical protein X943_001717 [Babesia divergens]